MLDVIVQQISDPVGWLDRAAFNRSWLRREYVIRIGLAIGTAALLVAIAISSGRTWSLLLAYAALALVPFMIGASVAVTSIGYPRFWLLWLISPPVLATMLLAGLGPLISAFQIIAWVIGVPLLLGTMLSCAGTLYVHARASAAARERTRHRAANPAANFPALAYQNLVRALRIMAASFCAALVLLALVLFWQLGAYQIGVLASAALLVAAAGCLRLDAAFAGWLGRSSLVINRGSAGLRATYAGRWTLFAPKAQVLPLMTTSQTGVGASEPLLALLREGSLGPVIRKYAELLTIEQAYRLVLSLSLQPGGASILRYLQPGLPQLIQPAAATYAAFADEAVRPLDLQRWVTTLTERPGLTPLLATDLSTPVVRVLEHARAALLDYTYTPAHDVAIEGLQRLVDSCYPNLTDDDSPHRTHAGEEPTGWPVVLLRYVVAHGQLLYAAQAGTSAGDRAF
jgi:hypothetical protein